MHAPFLQLLSQVANPRLISAYRDARLGMPEQNVLRVFIPDIHLISNQRRIEGGFEYGANDPDLLLRLLRAFKSFQLTALDNGQQVMCYQLGDFLDLWRETPVFDRTEDTAIRIENDFLPLIQAFYDPALNAQFLLGNHDFDLWNFPNFQDWERRYFLPSVQEPAAIVLHGDIFSWIESLPDPLQQVFVYFFAPAASPETFETGHAQAQRVITELQAQRNFQNAIQTSRPVLNLNAPDAPTPFNVHLFPGDAADKLEFFEAAEELCQRANAQFNTRLRMAIIGHTHHPRIVVRDDPQSFFVLVDCGAWIEQCELPDGQVLNSAHIAVVCDDEIRLYQLL